MKTITLKVDPIDPGLPEIQEAAALLRSGKLIAFPTDTVYGIGVDVFNEEAIRQIFAAKKRDIDKPLQVLIANKEDLQIIAREQSETLDRLVSKFWPGPLTIVMPAKEDFPRRVRCDRDTIGVRMPSNPIALRLIKAFGRPIAATSANISGSPDPMSAGEVLEYLSGEVSLILDGGPTPGSVPSTVLDISVNPPNILRRGKLSIADLEKVLSI